MRYYRKADPEQRNRQRSRRIETLGLQKSDIFLYQTPKKKTLTNQDSMKNFLNYLSVENSECHNLKLKKYNSQKKEREIQRIKVDISMLRDRVATESKVSSKVEELRYALTRKAHRNNQYRFPQIFQFPTIPPCPHYNFFQNYEPSQSRVEDPKLSKKRKLKKYNRHHNKQQLKRRFRKVVWAVLFTIHLRKYSERIQKGRQQYFNSIWPTRLQLRMREIRNWVHQTASPLYVKICSFSDSSLSIIEGEDSRQKRFVKSNMILKAIKLMMETLRNSLKGKGIPDNHAKLIHGFCKHGAFLAKGALTHQQIKLMCFSEKHGYCRMNLLLQKVSIIHFFFIKLLIFNSILCIESYSSIFSEYLSSEQQTQNIEANVYMISSVLFQICLQLRDSYLLQNQQFGQEYPLNNWNKCSYKKGHRKQGIKCCKSLKYKYCKQQDENDGQLIAGLMDIKKFHKNFHPPTRYEETTGIIEEIIQLIHNCIKDVHLQYKRMAYQ